MLLRTRIILIVCVLVAVPMAIMSYAFLLRDAAADAEAAALRLENYETIWDEVMGSAMRAAQSSTSALLQEPGLLEAIREGDQSRLGVLERRVEEATGLDRIDIFTAGDDLFYTTDDTWSAQLMLDEGQWSFFWIDAPTFGARVVGGHLVGVAAAPIMVDGARLGTSVTSVDLDRQRVQFAEALGAEVFVVDPDGARVGGGDGPLWQSIAGTMDPSAVRTVGRSGDDRRDRVVDVAIGENRWQVGKVAVADVGGGLSAVVLVARNVTDEAARRALVNVALIAGLVGGGVTVIALLWVYLRDALRPLDDGIEALNALSAGRTDHYAELPGGFDEVGQIGRSIDVFRSVAVAAQHAAEERERRRRRQARFIRRQMAKLSETLDAEAREAAIEDLRQIEAAAAAEEAARDRGEAGDEIGLIAIALERLTSRVRDQQGRLSGLVADLREALAAKTRLVALEQELDIARAMQHSVLPRDFPPFGDFEVDARMLPAREVGGDFYDVFALGEDRLGVVVADVSGKGVPAAFFMLIARTLMKAVAGEGEAPSAVLARLNDLLAEENEQMMFVTLFYGVLERESGRLTYTNGGHNPPALRRADGRVEWLAERAGIALAVMAGLPYEDHAVTLAPGDAVFLYTDGVTEAVDPDDALFGEARLEATLAESAGNASTLLSRVFDAVQAFARGAPQADDLTAVALRRRPPGA